MDLSNLLYNLVNFRMEEMRALLKGLIEVQNADGVVDKRESKMLRFFVYSYKNLILDQIVKEKCSTSISMIRKKLQHINKDLEQLYYENPRILKKIMKTDIFSIINDETKKEVFLAWLVILSGIDDNIDPDEMVYIHQYFQEWKMDFKSIYEKYLFRIYSSEFMRPFFENC